MDEGGGLLAQKECLQDRLAPQSMSPPAPTATNPLTSSAASGSVAWQDAGMKIFNILVEWENAPVRPCALIALAL